MWSKILTLVAVVAAAVPSSTIWLRNTNRPIRNLYKLFHHNEVFSDDILNGRLRQGLREEIGRLLGNELYTKNTQIVTKMSFGRIEADIRPKSVDITADVLVRISDSNCRRKRGILERQLQNPIEANGLEGPKKTEGPRDHKHAEGNHPGHQEHSKREEKDSHHSKHTENHSKHPEHSKHPGHPHHSKHPEHPHHSKHPEHCRATHKNEAECYLTYREHSSRSLLELRHHESQYSIHNVYCRLLGDSSEHHSHSEHHGKHDHSHHTHSKHHKEQSHHSQSKHEKHDHPHSKKEHKHEQSHSNLIPHSRHEEKKHHSKIEEHGQEKNQHHAQLKKDAQSLHSDPKRQLRNDGAGRQMRAPPFNPFRI